jgi:hypothetical protein
MFKDSIVKIEAMLGLAAWPPYAPALTPLGTVRFFGETTGPMLKKVCDPWYPPRNPMRVIICEGAAPEMIGGFATLNGE